MRLIEEIKECQLTPMSEDELFGIRGGGDPDGGGETAKRTSDCVSGSNTDKCGDCGTNYLCFKFNKCSAGCSKP